MKNRFFNPLLAALMLATSFAHAQTGPGLPIPGQNSPARDHQGHHHEDGHDHSDAMSSEVLLSRENLARNRGHMYIVYHTNGHSNGHEHVLELRPDCLKRAKDFRKLEVKNLKTACELLPNTARFFADKELVTVEGYDLNFEEQQKNMKRNPPITEPVCETRKKLFALPTSKLCRK